MINASEIKKGITIEIDGEPYIILDHQHTMIAQRSAHVKLKLRNIKAGYTVERTFQAGDRFTRVRLERRTMQYLYSDGELYCFMDSESFEQSMLSREQLGDTLNYLKEGMSLEVLIYQEEPIGVELPTSVELEVVDTGPGFKGDTATAGNKPARLETGITIQVPLFINNGDIVKVDTRTGEYLERVS